MEGLTDQLNVTRLNVSSREGRLAPAGFVMFSQPFLQLRSTSFNIQIPAPLPLVKTVIEKEPADSHQRSMLLYRRADEE
jgi:hypothetical protein